MSSSTALKLTRSSWGTSQRSPVKTSRVAESATRALPTHSWFGALVVRAEQRRGRLASSAGPGTVAAEHASHHGQRGLARARAQPHAHGGHLAALGHRHVTRRKPHEWLRRADDADSDPGLPRCAVRDRHPVRILVLGYGRHQHLLGISPVACVEREDETLARCEHLPLVQQRGAAGDRERDEDPHGRGGER